ncbi:MAG: hypothetical protein MJ062_01930 [Oscillospiraceae bacterium]|nr:hypothetical protein [Oscillospiraceae bacterium]
MEKFVPYEKLSKKAKKEIDEQKRGDWDGVNPVTKIIEENPKAYKRKPKHPNRSDDWE